MIQQESKSPKVRVNITLKETTNDVLWRLTRYREFCLIWSPEERTEEALRSHPYLRTNLIKFLLEEAAYATEDWIDQQISNGASDRDLSNLLTLGGIRFDFVPCSGGVRRRGLAREDEYAGQMKAVDELLAKISQETDSAGH